MQAKSPLSWTNCIDTNKKKGKRYSLDFEPFNIVLAYHCQTIKI